MRLSLDRHGMGPSAPFVVLGVALAAVCGSGRCMNVSVDGQHVVDQLVELAQFSADPAPAVTRVLFTREGAWQGRVEWHAGCFRALRPHP